uniref:Keratin n=1 Tax=Meleagris gallopavo TaxID=9103 RepID=A0A803YL25_MELGA
MSCCNPCVPCQPCGPTPLASSCNEPCVRQCQDSTIVIEPSPVVVTLPGPILSSFPQNTAVGSSTSAAVGSILSCQGVPITSGALTSPAFPTATVAEGAPPAKGAGHWSQTRTPNDLRTRCWTAEQTLCCSFQSR